MHKNSHKDLTFLHWYCTEHDKFILQGTFYKNKIYKLIN